MLFHRALRWMLSGPFFQSPFPPIEPRKPDRFRPAKHSRRSVPDRTGPLHVLKGRNVLLLADDENLRYSARDLGYNLSYRTLAAKVQSTTKHCDLHAFFSHDASDRRRTEYFTSRGWTPHGYRIQTVETCRGTERLTNADNLILFAAGQLAIQSNPDVVVIASGDGTLVCDIATFLTTSSNRIRVITLSLANSTSSRLSSSRNSRIAANIEIGQDCLTHDLHNRMSKRNGRQSSRKRFASHLRSINHH